MRVNICAMLMFLVATLASCLGDQDAGSPPLTLSVCGVLATDPTRLNGQILTVRGSLSGTDEGIWLSGQCETHLVTKGLVWGNDLAVLVETSDETQRSWDKMRRTLDQLRVKFERDEVEVTFVGKLVTRNSMDEEVIQRPYGLVKAGFGHMGASPAEIDVISVVNVNVKRRR